MLSVLTVLEGGADVEKFPYARTLIRVLTSSVGISTAGYPYLQEASYHVMRDEIPHILGMGSVVMDTLEHLELVAKSHPERGEISSEGWSQFEGACKVVRTILNTACVTAPPDLWLLRQILGTFKDLGLVDRWLAGESVDPQHCTGKLDGESLPLDGYEVEFDLSFLLSRGYLHYVQGGYALSQNAIASDVMNRVSSVEGLRGASKGAVWCRFFSDSDAPDGEYDALLELTHLPDEAAARPRSGWYATYDEIELGFRLVPIVLGLRASGWTQRMLEAESIRTADFDAPDERVIEGVLELLRRAGILRAAAAEAFELTPIGRRVCDKGPGPFGIIEAYHPYMAHLQDILGGNRAGVRVSRGPNVAASQLANRSSFEKANNALDRFCEATGFSYDVYVEHALGRGEATRQRYGRSGDERVRYMGADLEEAAIAAAREEQARGNLPPGMRFIADADIANPSLITTALSTLDPAPQGVVMVVGNGFHEVRGKSEDRVIDVFRGYHDAGILLIFTEESAICVDDLLETGWNTYHAGFKYVHERSGQGLRPAREAPTPPVGEPVKASWDTCATRAGYVRAESYCTRTRTIFPYRPQSGHNPAISVNHFYVPGPLAASLGLV